ncbi:MAG: efflux RND transporter periplasmic adaptor subunit [Syntrophaceae bacterium]
MSRKISYWVLAPLAVMVFLQACSSEQPPQKNRPVPVLTALSVRRDVPISISAFGTVEAAQAISVRSQITALITKVHFKEGQTVKKGDLLIELDCRSNLAALKQAEANLLRDIAQAMKAEQDVRRYAALLEKNYVSREEYDQMRTNYEALQATLKADQALVDSNRVQMQYCSIYAPIDALAGRLQVDEGNILKANDVEVVSLNQIQPINVTFAIPEKDLPRVRKYAGDRMLEVIATLPGEEKPERGKLSFVDNAIDKSTGTIKLRGSFANTEKRLLPGQYVNVVLMLATSPAAVVVPSQAVNQGQDGQYVYVVSAQSTAQIRPITVGQVIDGETVILKGLLAGERVVTDGQMRLTPGATLTVKNTK